MIDIYYFIELLRQLLGRGGPAEQAGEAGDTPGPVPAPVPVTISLFFLPCLCPCAQPRILVWVQHQLGVAFIVCVYYCVYLILCVFIIECIYYYMYLLLGVYYFVYLLFCVFIILCIYLQLGSSTHQTLSSQGAAPHPVSHRPQTPTPRAVGAAGIWAGNGRVSSGLSKLHLVVKTPHLVKVGTLVRLGGS